MEYLGGGSALDLMKGIVIILYLIGYRDWNPHLSTNTRNINKY